MGMKSVGSLKDRALIEVCQQERDASGGFVNTWASFGAMWVEVRSYSGFEQLASRKRGGLMTVERTEFRTRWREDLKPTKHRLVYNGANYNILSLAGRKDDGILILVCDTGGEQ